MNALRLCPVLALWAVARPAGAQLDSLPPQWVPWGAVQPPPPDRGGPFGLPLARSASPSASSGRDTSGGAPSFQQSSFQHSTTSFPQSSSGFSPLSGFAPSSSGFAQSSSGFAPSSSGFAPSSSGFVPSSSGFVPTSSNFPHSSSHFPGSSSHFAPSSGPFQPSQSSFPSSSSFQASHPSFSPPSHASGSAFGQSHETPTHSAEHYQECAYDSVCVDEYQCPPYGRSASASPGPRTFTVFTQPPDGVRPGLDPRAAHDASPHDSHHSDSHNTGTSCGYNRVCCRREFVTHHQHHRHHSGPPPYHQHHGGYGGPATYGPYGGGHLSHGTHSAYNVYPDYLYSYGPSYSGRYGHGGGYFPSYPSYSGGYPQYPSYQKPYYPSYQLSYSYPSYPPPFQPYPPQPYPGAHSPFGAPPHFGGPQAHHDRSQGEVQGSPTGEADDGKMAAPSSRTSRMFL